MSEYLFLFRGGDFHLAKLSPDSLQQHMQKWVLWMSGLAEQGKFVSAQPLAKTGKQINGDKKIVTDGPFIEGKEMVGGYLICKADTYDGAIEIAKGCPILEFEDGNVEVRLLQDMNM